MANTNKPVYVYKEVDTVVGIDVVKYRVYPAVMILNRNESIELVNTTDKEAVWDDPEGLLEDPPNNDKKVPKHDRKSRAPKKNGLYGGRYVVTVDGERAHGHSDPVIIIDT